MSQVICRISRCIPIILVMIWCRVMVKNYVSHTLVPPKFILLVVIWTILMFYVFLVRKRILFLFISCVPLIVYRLNSHHFLMLWRTMERGCHWYVERLRMDYTNGHRTYPLPWRKPSILLLFTVSSRLFHHGTIDLVTHLHQYCAISYVLSTFKIVLSPLNFSVTRVSAIKCTKHHLGFLQ